MLESHSLTQKAEQAVVAMIEAHDAHRSTTRRFSLLFVGSALLHIVAVIALLRSWGSGPVKSTARAEPEHPQIVEDIQVVRLELAVSQQSASEAIQLTKADVTTETENALQLTAPDKTIVK
jgi:hypothetical protein